jgi:hypothetical protein
LSLSGDVDLAILLFCARIKTTVLAKTTPDVPSVRATIPGSTVPTPRTSASAPINNALVAVVEESIPRKQVTIVHPLLRTQVSFLKTWFL